ncbi:hypothetical protein ACOMHN_040509 [Nucella lapillus]
MTSSGDTPAVANIVWDKSRLHGDHRNNPHRTSAPLNRAPSSGEATRHPQNGIPPSSSYNPYHPGGRHRMVKSDLTMSFDPMKDLHMWTMWRVAVNGRIVDETRRRKQSASENERGGDPPPNPYLVKTPLDRFIRVDNGSRNIAGVLMDPHGQGGASLATQQFVYYGVPRVVLKKAKKVVHLP